MDAGEAYEGTVDTLNSTDYKVEPRFAEKPLYTVRDLWLQVTDKKFLDTLKEKRNHADHKLQSQQTAVFQLFL